MLQQTRVEAVIAYWYKWMERFPTISHLAKASPDEVNSYWAGLGYYRRAQNLLKGAQVVMSKYNGQIPETVAELLTIPGVGPYTAGAIASVAYGHVECVVDGNVIRVLSRLRALQVEGRELEKSCWRLSAVLVDPKDPGNFNQALMEFGAMMCKPVNPICLEIDKICPLSSICMARRLTTGVQLPEIRVCLFLCDLI
ncbi:MUTYH [Symbiodinium microadriaticum]|nr:MUTYH [Symbiodinium microadriaticum]